MTDYSATHSSSQSLASEASDRDASSILVAQDRAFQMATRRLSEALARAADGNGCGDVAEARLHLRSLAVRLRDAGYWRHDRNGLRATVALLWQADRFVSEQVLLRSDSTGV